MAAVRGNNFHAAILISNTRKNQDVENIFLLISGQMAIRPTRQTSFPPGEVLLDESRRSRITRAGEPTAIE